VKLCHYFSLTRQAYYKGLKQGKRKQLQHEVVIEMVHRIRRSNKKMGGKKLYHLLKPQIKPKLGGMGRDKFFDLLRARKLLVWRRRRYMVTTQSKHRFTVYTNKLMNASIERPHQAWVCDITYLRIRKGFVYLFLMTDVYSRKIVGWDLNKSLGLEGAFRSLSMAMGQCPIPKGLIHHSDRGFQYCNPGYTKKLEDKGIQISMGEVGNCYENAMAERVNGILKYEYGLEETFADEKEALQAAKQAIEAYNNQRPHWSLNLQIPADVHDAA
jgi:putative transposase